MQWLHKKTNSNTTNCIQRVNKRPLIKAGRQVNYHYKLKLIKLIKFINQVRSQKLIKLSCSNVVEQKKKRYLNNILFINSF